MTNHDLPTIDNLDSEQLLKLRAAIDARLQEIRADLIEQAQRLGLAVSDGAPNKRRGRPRKEDVVSEE